MADPAVAEALFQQYPWVRALFGVPELQALILEAVDPNVGFDPNAFQAKLFNTTWFQTTPEPQRQAFIRESTDPATWALQTHQQNQTLVDWMQTTGVNIDHATRVFLSAAMEQRGEDINTAGSKLALRDWMRAHPESMTAGGRWAAATQQVYALARREYFLPVEWWWAQGWATGLVTGEVDETTLRESLLAHSKAAFPQMSDWIIQGMTPAEIIDPLRAFAADELEVGVEQIDIGRPEWRFLTGVANTGGTNKEPSGTQGGWRLPTESEIREQARRDGRWWDTSKGREADASMSQFLLQTMGVRG